MRLFRYDINSMVAFEEAVGESLAALASDRNKLSSFRILRALYWAGTDIKSSLEEAGDRMMEDIAQGSSFEEIGESMVKALIDSGLMGEAKGENPRKKGKTQSLT